MMMPSPAWPVWFSAISIDPGVSVMVILSFVSMFTRSDIPHQ
jgi:hypothetical protein